MAHDSKKKEPISLKRAFGFVVPICVCSLFLAAAVISLTNDMYAFVKPEGEVTLTISSALDTREFAKLLADEGVLKNPFVFELYLRSKGKTAEIPYLRGEWTLRSDMSYRDILLEFF